MLVHEILVLQREIGNRLLDKGDGILQIIAVLAGDAHGVALDAGLHLHLAVLEQLDNFLRQLDFHADLHFSGTLDLVAADLIDLLADFQALDVHAALGQLAVEDVLHLAELEFVVGKHGELELGLLDTRVGTLEIEARADFLVGLLERVLDLGLVYFGNDVEAWHAVLPLKNEKQILSTKGTKNTNKPNIKIEAKR